MPELVCAYTGPSSMRPNPLGSSSDGKAGASSLEELPGTPRASTLSPPFRTARDAAVARRAPSRRSRRNRTS